MKLSAWIPQFSLLLLALVGCFAFTDYGISTDEQQSRLVGNISLNYIANLFNISFLLNGSIPLQNATDVFLNFNDRDYGVIFELPAEFLIKIFQIKSTANALYFRHGLTFLIFLGGVAAVYALAKKRYADWRWGFVAATFLVFSPRIFGDSFFNDKDLVFMSLFVIGFNTLVNFIKNPSFKTAFLHGLACAIAIDSRIMATIIPLATIFVLCIQILKRNNLSKEYIRLFPIYLIVFLFFTYAFWPWLWENPITNFIQAFKNMSNFRWSGMMFFMGGIINGVNVPWYYIPVWISVTTPLLYLVFFLIGCVLIIKKILSRRLALWNNSTELQDVITLGFFWAPLVAVISLNSILYNGWRHLYFIYPAFVLISTHGLFCLWNYAQSRRFFQRIILFIVTISIVWTGIWMIINHPYQYLYFNILAGNWTKNFDVDYWGVAYKRPLEKILVLNPNKTVVIFNKMQGLAWGYWQIPYWENTFLLTKADQNRIDGTRSEQCSDFVITSIAGNAKQYSQNKDFTLIDQIKIDGRLVYATFQRITPIDEIYPRSKSPIHFSNNATQCFLKKGWSSSSEDWGVWSTSKEATLELSIPKNPIQSLDLNMRAFVSPKLPTQDIIITLNNEKPIQFKLNKFDQNTLKLIIPASAINLGTLKIKFEIPKAESPKSLGISDDDRSLGIGLISATFQ